jgi:hypothetical protein
MNYKWKPIETAPTDGSIPIFIAKIIGGEVKAIDYDAMIQTDYESWEMPQEYSYWASAFGNVEEPTHWCEMPQLPSEETNKTN